MSNFIAPKSPEKVQTEDQKGMSRVKFFFHQALDADESGETANALEMYMKAVEISLETVCFSTIFSAAVKLNSGI